MIFLSGEYKRVLTRRPQGRIFATGLTIVGLHFYKSLLECGRTFSGFSGPENSGLTIVGLHFYKSLLECGRTFSEFSGPENSGM